MSATPELENSEYGVYCPSCFQEVDVYPIEKREGAYQREQILLRVSKLKRFDDIEEAQGCGVEPSEDGWLVDYEGVIAAIRGEQA